MRLATHDNKLETNAKVVSQDFGIGDASVVIEILRNRLYEHKVRTLVQEYLCNGRDAQREIGSTARMQVTIPNPLNPVFKVRDFGPGISPDRMGKVFVMYGASTKRNTNGQTGGFGIGAKSAWSYTDSFTIVSYTDGIARTYVAHTGVNNQGRLDLISEVETAEPNGTEIQVAIKPNDAREFRDSVYRAIHYWSESERPELKGITAIDIPERSKPYVVSASLAIARDLPDYLALGYYAHTVLIIDGIPYGVKDGMHVPSLDKLRESVKGKLLIRLDNGVVDVSASRESLADSKMTKDNLETVCAKLLTELAAHVKGKFASVKSNAEWIAMYSELNKIMNVDEYSAYGKYSIKAGGIASAEFSKVLITKVSYRARGKNTEIKRDIVNAFDVEKIGEVFTHNASESLVIENRRLRDYFLNNKTDKLYVVESKEIAADANNPNIVPLPRKTSEKVLKGIVSDFNARELNSLPFTPVTREARAKRDRTKEMFTIHEIWEGGSKHPKTTTLAALASEKRKYLYIPFAKYAELCVEVGNVVSFLNEQGFCVCAITDQSLKVVEGSGLFFSYSEWKENYKPDAKIINMIKRDECANYDAMQLIASASGIKDKHVLKMLNEYKPILNTHKGRLPANVKAWFKNEIKDFIDNDKKLHELIKTKYLLWDFVACSRGGGKKVVDELVCYINNK